MFVGDHTTASTSLAGADTVCYFKIFNSMNITGNFAASFLKCSATCLLSFSLPVLFLTAVNGWRTRTMEDGMWRMESAV